MGTTILHPLAALVFALLTLWTFVVSRRYVIWALLFISCFISPAQRFAFFTIDFHFQRAITVIILIRIVLMGEFQGIRLRNIDYALFGSAGLVILCSAVRDGGAFLVGELGRSLDGVGIYLIARAYVRHMKDLRYVLIGAAIAAVPVMIGFVIEKSTSRNLFSIFGGVPEITVIRDDRLRAQGAFTHPIIAGVFWAAFTPLFIAVILSKAKALWSFFVGWIGTISAVLAAFMTASSTPIGGILIGLICWVLFPLRGYLRVIRWTLLFAILFLHAISQNGVHAILFTKISFVGASTGYHRYLLIDGLMQGFSKWALIGNRTTQFNYAFRDITNDYILTALNGGLLALALKIAVIAFAFASIGRMMRAAQNRADLLLSYGLGASLVTVIISMTAVSMYVQGEVSVFLTLGMAASLGDPAFLRSGQFIGPSTNPIGR